MATYGYCNDCSVIPYPNRYLYRMFGWLLPVARLYEPGRRESGSRDVINLLEPAEPGPGCFKYRASLTPHLHAGNQTHTSHA
jgi:hypothetical protein